MSPSYKAEQAKDGTWTIYEVPIFAVHVDTRGGKPVAFSLEWLEQALRKGKTRHAEGYYPPLHISHHGSEGEVEAAGKVRFREIRPHAHGGDRIPTLFADLVGVRPDVYKRIRKGELSYRSVEILDVDSPEIDSLALLDSEVPYFRFPLLKIGSEKRAQKSPALAYSAAGRRASVLFSFEDPHMKKQDEELDQEAEMVEESPPEAAPAWAEAIMGMLGKIAESLGVDYQADEEKKEEEKEPVEDAAAALQAEPLQVGLDVAQEMKSEAQTDALSATVASLKAELAALKEAAEIDGRASALKEKGFSAEHVAKYRTIARTRGAVAASYWADAMEEHAPVEPPAGFSGELAPPKGSVDCAEVRRYGNKGPEALELARSIARSYAATKPDMSLEEYLEINMDTEGYFAASRAAAGKGA